MKAKGPGNAAGTLAGRHVVVTRPAAQAEAFCRMLAAAGARVTRFPVIEIRGPKDPLRLGAVLDALEGFDLAVFVSANAVQRGLAAVRARGAWPTPLRVAAIGAGTARELQNHGRAADIVPGARFDSEALLQEPALQDLTGRKVVIFRGDGGREHLAGILRERGATVTYAETYRRAMPDLDPEPLRAQLKTGAIDAITVTSGEGLHNLVAMLGAQGRSALLRAPLVVGATRVGELAQELGFHGAIERAEDPTDAAMFRAVEALLAG
ncbi:uroporphyrinogen-III synthase [Thioalkalivibrio sp.]|uniref:uroporphyrinogen-III synthase n=1 Tax=Thioalkalivibrio sp. TaxID=2093813 RepID=UPI003975539A